MIWAKTRSSARTQVKNIHCRILSLTNPRRRWLTKKTNPPSKKATEADDDDDLDVLDDDDDTDVDLGDDVLEDDDDEYCAARRNRRRCDQRRRRQLNLWIFRLQGQAGLPKHHACNRTCGALAQLGERFAGSEEVRSSILLGSTKTFPNSYEMRCSISAQTPYFFHRFVETRYIDYLYLSFLKSINQRFICSAKCSIIIVIQ